MPVSFDIETLPQLESNDAAFGSLVSAGQLMEPTLFDVIIIVIIATDGK